MRWIKWYAVNLFIAIDQLINAVFGGWSDETMSSHAYRLWRDEKPWGYVLKPLYDALFVWQAWDLNHCERAYVKERDRVHLPPEMRDTNGSS